MKNSLAVITGATSGIGRALTQKFISEGFYVFAIGRDKSKFDHLREIEHNEKIIPCQCDLTQTQEVIEATNKLFELSETHELNYIVHNATTLDPIKPLTETTTEEMQNQMLLNVTGPMLLTNSLLNLLNAGTRILFISTGASRTAVDQLVPHCTAKAAQVILAQGYRNELKTKDVLVGIIEPGIVNTPAQECVRSMSSSILPFSSIARKAYAEGNYFSSEECSILLFNLLVLSDNETFSGKWPWQFSNEEHLSELRAMATIALSNPDLKSA